uniref:Uncharacterized protein n=1 Tax=Romanomermis culicivorax TaxID=13658 RepID=A0A915KCW6_ROMCU
MLRYTKISIKAVSNPRIAPLPEPLKKDLMPFQWPLQQPAAKRSHSAPSTKCSKKNIPLELLKSTIKQRSLSCRTIP